MAGRKNSFRVVNKAVDALNGVVQGAVEAETGLRIDDAEIEICLSVMDALVMYLRKNGQYATRWLDGNHAIRANVFGASKFAERLMDTAFSAEGGSLLSVTKKDVSNATDLLVYAIFTLSSMRNALPLEKEADVQQEA